MTAARTSTAAPTDGAASSRGRFNSGYHDARGDAARGAPRLLVDDLPADTAIEVRMRHVSRAYDAVYALGYAEGLTEHDAQLPHTTSDGAWERVLLRAAGAINDPVHVAQVRREGAGG